MSSAVTARSWSERWAQLDKNQLLKWVVYSLLLLNWFYYFFEEVYTASHTLRHGADLLKWAETFATSIDTFAWLGLLFMFELETYSLEQKTLDRRSVRWVLHGLRLVFYAMLLHTVVARVSALDDTLSAPRATQSDLCQLVGEDISFGRNLRYQLIDADNCQSFSAQGPFYFLDPSVVTDAAGWKLEKQHVWIDLSDALVWLLVIWSIELAVWLQNRKITGGRLMVVSYAVKVLYAALFCHAGFWIWTGHWVYAWDQALWILGFWAIEKNLAEWRWEIRQLFGDAAARPGSSSEESLTSPGR
jgi:hypothetical protein